MTTGTLSDQRVRWATIAMSIAALLIIVLHIPAVFAALGGVAVLWITDLANVAAAGTGCVLAFLLWAAFEPSEPHKAIWGALAVGLLLWSLGEGIWAFFEMVLQQEIPYPSVADIAWVIGYIPLFVGLWLRYRTLRMTPPTSQLVVVLAVFVALVVVAVIFVIWPIVTYPEYEPIEKFLDSLYPVGDLVVALGALLSMLALSGGTMFRSWALLAAGLLLISGSDILFSYTTWNEIYVYDRPDLLSAIVDVSYFAAYILIALGIYIQARIQRVA
jgi:hypothetical protein